MIKIKKGLNLPISGEPEQAIYDVPYKVKHVALGGEDYIGMKPTMAVKVGDQVKRGTLLFTDKKIPEIKFCAPAGGKIIEINRGHKRVLQSVVIEIDEDLDQQNAEKFEAYSKDQLSSLSYQEVSQMLIDSGSWPALRVRPFSRLADPKRRPKALFINAMDTRPLAPSVELILNQNMEDFIAGVNVLKVLPEEKTYICTAHKKHIPTDDLEDVDLKEFAGPHPAGLVGTHIHFLHPVNSEKIVWHLDYQEVIAIGKLFKTGKVDVERTISLGGPSVKKPRLLRVRLGCKLSDLTTDELKGGKHRVVSGSVLYGHEADGPHDYLGRYHHQVSVLPGVCEREFLGWHDPGVNKFSVTRVFLSSLLPKSKFAFDCGEYGSPRALVPVGSYEKLMPLDILPTFLLKSLMAGDNEQAQALGALELDEEDLSLCTFADPGKTDFGKLLRESLTVIEKDG